jgi:hypothetical protein
MVSETKAFLEENNNTSLREINFYLIDEDIIRLFGKILDKE